MADTGVIQDVGTARAANGHGRLAPDDPLARSLGWFSAALGTPQVLAPELVYRIAGIEEKRARRPLMRMVGVRELAAAAGILGLGEAALFLWARVVGDAMDLTMLGLALGNQEHRRSRVAIATLAVFGVTAADVVAAVRNTKARERASMHTKVAITVNRPPQEVYSFWRDFENLPQIMTHLESVETGGAGRSHWKASAPVGSVEWDAEVTADVPGERIEWRSIEGAQVHNSGAVRFRPAPGGRGTEVVVELRYQPPAGALGDVVAKMFGEGPTTQVKDDLRRFKQVMETGEVVRSEATPDGVRVGRLLKQQPAQPVA